MHFVLKEEGKIARYEIKYYKSELTTLGKEMEEIAKRCSELSVVSV